MLRRWDAVIVVILTMVFTVLYASTPAEDYDKVQSRLAQGWNTWNTHSLLSHVLLPHGLAVNIGLKYSGVEGDSFLNSPLVEQEKENAVIQFGPHAWDGSYTELIVTWQGARIKVQSAVENRDWYILLSPEIKADRPLIAYAEAGMLWNFSGSVAFAGDHVEAVFPDSLVNIYASGQLLVDAGLPVLSPYLAIRLDNAVGFCTGAQKSISEIQSVINQKKMDLDAAAQKFGNSSDAYLAMQSVVAWNTIYDAGKKRVITTPDRLQNKINGGWALNATDIFYSALMTLPDYKDLALANIVEILRENTELGFVPATVCANGKTTLDRSALPLGSTAVLKYFKKYKEKWLLELVFQELLTWNRWWDIYRNYDGLLSWGSNPYSDPFNDPARGNLRAAILESGTVNSPMYDLVPFNDKTQLMELWDVGLNSLYVMDCKALAEIAVTLGKTSEERELRMRGEQYADNIERLWDDKAGLYVNVRTDTDEKSSRISPTSFYPLIAKIPDEARAKKMVETHLLDPQKFWGNWIVPSISKTDQAYKDNNYWRGRIVAPVNFFLYLGLDNYDMAQFKTELAEKSQALLVNGWSENGCICENFNAETGMGNDIEYNKNFNLCSGLLGLISLMNAGQF